MVWQLRGLSPHTHSPPGLLSLEQEDFGLQGGRSRQPAKMRPLWTFPSKAPQLLRPPSWSGVGTGRGGGWGKETLKHSLWVLLTWLAGSVKPAEARVLCVRDSPEGQGSGAPQDIGMGRGALSHGSEQGALVGCGPGKRCDVNWVCQPLGGAWG